MHASTRVEQLLVSKGKDVHSVMPDTSVLEALEVLARHNIGALAVTEAGRLVGMFSERDYARKVILQGKASRDTPVRDSMTADVVTVTPSDDMSHCMQLMTERRIRHLPVLNDDELVGLISVGDVVKAVMEEQRFMIEQLESYIRS
ncbi:MAG TPA: CBS domain-containing protein [Deinococcales bacterium]|nr:CBS domain-containing protein [Deinococcales bacterium]